mmetsp:Transcript_25152/g.24615  ORF Transcript_25152/g.24615 Transcript_25152/m.24615 type:complete len:147 (-) Transcript_25152:40-480(-)
MFIYYLRKVKCLGKKTVKKCSLGRFILTVLVCFTCALFIFFMFKVVDIEQLEYLSHKECSSSVLLNKAFVTMYGYFDSVGTKNWISFVFVALIVLVDMASSIYNSFAKYKEKRDKKKMKQKIKDEKQEALLAGIDRPPYNVDRPPY